MNPIWHTFLTTHGARFAAASAESTESTHSTELVDFGQPDAELQAAATGTVLIPLTHLGLIRCDDAEAATFLHNQLTSDINHLANEQAQHSAWCTAKGRMLASFIVWRQEEGYRLALAAELIPAIAKRLQMYVLRSKVKITDLSDNTALLGLAGPNAASALSAAGLPAPVEAMTTAESDGIKVIRLDTARYVVAATPDQMSALWPVLALNARPAGVPVWRWLDVIAAVPLITGATREEFVPQMADFEKIGGVSFHKGCYPGQEIVARTQYLGKVKRHLFRVSSDAPLQAGDDLYSTENPDQSIGKVATAAPAPEGGYAALAVIQSNFAATARIGALDGPLIAATAVNPAV